jgi:hypothetical protein
MKNIDLVRELDSTLSASTREVLSRECGVSQDVIGHIVTGAASVLVAALMAAGSTLHGAPQVLAAIMADTNDARIGEWLHERLATTAGFREVEAVGEAFALTCLATSLSELGDCVADDVGVPAQPAFALTAVMAAILGGLVKHHLLIEQATPGDTTQLLANQWPLIEPYLTDVRAIALRFDGAVAFRDTIPAQLRVLAGNQQRGEASPLVPEPEGDRDVHQISTVALMDDRAGRGTLRWLVAASCLATVGGVIAAVFLLASEDSYSTLKHSVASAGAAMHQINSIRHR